MTQNYLMAGAMVALGSWAAASGAPASSHSIKNIVLVHGAFADGSGWDAVATILRRDGFSVSVAQPPETSLEEDVAAANRAINAMNGPVVLVGHSYGGIIISDAGNNERVKTLVFVAAFAPDKGESLGSLAASKPPAGAPLKPSPDGFLYVDQNAFHADFCADLPAAQASFMAISQVGLAAKIAGTPSGAPAWKVKPSYAIVATMDRSINPDLERSMYKRAGSKVTEVPSSHVAYMAHPDAVAAIIEQAAQ